MDTIPRDHLLQSPSRGTAGAQGWRAGCNSGAAESFEQDAGDQPARAFYSSVEPRARIMRLR